MKPLLFGKYCLLERVSVGGMAEVFRAKPFNAPDFHGYLALKRILPHLAEDEEFIKMFVDEAKLTVQLGHPSIVRIYELGQFQQSYYILMEFISGKDVLALQKTMRRTRDIIPVDMAMFIAREMARGLHFAHHKRDANGDPLNIIHRDVSPQNVLVDYRGRVKVIDFGIAKAAVQSTRTQVGVLKGKMGYMSPEQVRGEVLDYRSDIFSIGTVLWEMLTNRRLFHAENEFETMQKVRNASVDPPSTRNELVSPAVDAIVMRALTREPDDRYDTADEFADAIDAWLAEHPYSAEDLSVWMRTVFADDLDDERAKRDGFAAIVTAEDVLKLQEEAAAPPAAIPAPSAESAGDGEVGDESTDPDAAGPSDVDGIWVGGEAPELGEDISEFADQHTVVQAGGFDISEVAEDDDLETLEREALQRQQPAVAPPEQPPRPTEPPPPQPQQQHAVAPFESEDTNRQKIDAGTPRGVIVVAVLSILLLVVGGASAAAVFLMDDPAPVVTGALSITVTPETDLEILVDGKLVGNVSPHMMSGVALGSHVVEVKHPGFEPFRQTVEVGGASEVPVAVELTERETPAGFVALLLPREREGLAVYVDGERKVVDAKKVPTFELAPGKHLFEVLQKGYRPWTLVSSAEPGTRREERVQLKPSTFELEVIADKSSSVRFGKERLGRGTQTATGIEPSRVHKLTVTYRGQGVSKWQSYLGFPEIAQGTITVDFDKTLPRSYKKSQFGWLQVSTGDDWWEVLVDGVSTGVATPIDARAKLPIARGTHKLSFKRGDELVDRDIQINAGETFIFREKIDFTWTGE